MGLLRIVFGDSRCAACDRTACVCKSVQRGHRKSAKYDPPTAGKPVVHAAGRGRSWCECGCLIRNGRCSSVTCSVGK